MEDDWDLQAVVRSCATATATATATSTSTTTATDTFSADLHPRSCFPSFGVKQDDHFVFLPDPFERRNAIEELHELCKPFFPKSQPLSPHAIISSSPPLSAAIIGFQEQTQQIQQKQQQQQQQQPKQSIVGSVTSTASTSTAHSQGPRSKRRKNQVKKVCQVPAEDLSSGIWSWRKYGQKPIKGSPYPRGYYRCSTLKGCLARKQVERNRSDPRMFIVTYTGEHSHPAPTHKNSLAGSTRQKPLTPQQSVTAGESSKPSTKLSSCSSPAATLSSASMEDEVVQQSVTKGESRVEGEENMVEDDEEDELSFSDMAVSDDFFEGLEELTGPSTGDSFSGQFPASFSLPWLANSNAAAAAGSS